MYRPSPVIYTNTGIGRSLKRFLSCIKSILTLLISTVIHMLLTVLQANYPCDISISFPHGNYVILPQVLKKSRTVKSEFTYHVLCLNDLFKFSIVNYPSSTHSNYHFIVNSIYPAYS